MSRLRAITVTTWATACLAVGAVAWWSQDPRAKAGTFQGGSLVDALARPTARAADDYSAMWIVLAVLTIIALGVLAASFAWGKGRAERGMGV